METVTVLGGGISGLAVGYYLGRDRAVVYESESHYGGHVYSEEQDGFVWDDGPHVSYTKNEYIQQLFVDLVGGRFEEVQAEVVNYFKGHWIDHPAQSNLYQIPEPLRTQCLNSFLESRVTDPADLPPPVNYEEWIHRAFGRVFADTFPAVYTRKYWTREPADLGTDWIGKRVYYPKVEDVVNGAKGPLGRSTYWVNRWRYPTTGGFYTYTHKIAEGVRLEYGKKLVFVNFQKRLLGFEDGTKVNFDQLVSTLPLPALIACAEDAPLDVREAASMLKATRLLLVRVAANHPSVRKEPWLYVYDDDKISTRVSIQENFSPNNAPAGKTAMSVEVCGSDFLPLPTDRAATVERVQRELIEMGLLEGTDAIHSTTVRYCPWGQVIYDHQRRSALDRVNRFLDGFGVIRAGRYSQWGYMMTHDCVLRGKKVAEHLTSRKEELAEFEIDD
ncbi:MAG: FAD-dependent oxidoreductase [Acidobacteriota bacterium]